MSAQEINQPRLALDNVSKLELAITPSIALRTCESRLIEALEKAGYELPGQNAFPVVEISGATRADLPNPSGVCIGVNSGVSQIEVAAHLIASGKISGGNLLIVPQVHGFATASSFGENFLIAKCAVFLKDGHLVRAQFAEPVVLDVYDHSGGLHSPRALERVNRTSALPINSVEVQEIATDKFLSANVLTKGGFPTPATLKLDKGMSVEVLEAYFNNFVSANRLNAGDAIVIKPSRGARGEQVKFSAVASGVKDIQASFDTLVSDAALIIQPRVKNSFWNKENINFDFNLRIITTWQNGQVYTSPDMCEIRFRAFGDQPVNVTRGASAILLEEFFSRLEASAEQQEYLYRSAEELVKSAAEHVESYINSQSSDVVSGRKHSGMLGWDLLLTDENKWTILEINGGPVGGIGFIEGHQSEKGTVTIPLISHLLSQAEMSRRHLTGTLETIDPLVPIDSERALTHLFWDLFRIEEWDAARVVAKLTAEIFPDRASSWRQLGMIEYRCSGESKDALAFYDRGLCCPDAYDSSELYLTRGHRFYNDGQFELAFREYKAANNINPDDLDGVKFLLLALVKIVDTRYDDISIAEDLKLLQSLEFHLKVASQFSEDKLVSQLLTAVEEIGVYLRSISESNL